MSVSIRDQMKSHLLSPEYADFRSEWWNNDVNGDFDLLASKKLDDLSDTDIFVLHCNLLASIASKTFLKQISNAINFDSYSKFSP